MTDGKIDWKTARIKTRLAYSIIAVAVGIVLGIVMIGQGVHRIYLGIQDGADPLEYCAYAVMVTGGIAVIFLSRKDRIRMTGAYAIVLGLSRLFMRIDDILGTDDPRVIFIEVMFVMLAVNFIRVGGHFSLGNVVSRTSLIISSSILASTDIFIIIMDQYAEEYLEFLPFEIDSYFFVLNCVMYVAMIALLDTELIRENTVAAKHARILDRVRAAYSYEERSFILPETAKQLTERSGSMWREIDDGFVQSEITFEIITGDLRSEATAQIWKGKDPLFITIISKGDSIFNAERLRIDELTESEGVLCGYGRDGARIRFEIREEEQ